MVKMIKRIIAKVMRNRIRMRRILRKIIVVKDLI